MKFNSTAWHVLVATGLALAAYVAELQATFKPAR